MSEIHNELAQKIQTFCTQEIKRVEGAVKDRTHRWLMETMAPQMQQLKEEFIAMFELKIKESITHFMEHHHQPLRDTIETLVDKALREREDR